MPFFSAALTSDQLNTLRGSGITGNPSYRADQFIAICPNTVIFAARVNQSTFAASYAQVTFDTVTTGAYTDIVVGQTIYISPTNNIRQAVFVGRIRATPTSTILYIDETSAAVGDNYYIWVIDDFRLWNKLARDVSGTQFKDYDLAFTTSPPIISGIQSAYAGFISGSPAGYTVAFAAVGTALTFGATIASYAYDIQDGTVTAGNASTANVTIRFPAGFRWISLTVTDSLGKSTTLRIPVWAYDDGNGDTFTTTTGFTGASISCDERGYNATVSAFDGVEDVLDNTLVCVWTKEYYNGTAQSINGNVQFVGRLRKESAGSEGNATYSTLIKDTSFELEGIGAQLARTTAPLLTLLNVTADAWDEIVNLTIWRGIAYILLEHSTLCSIASLSFDSTDNAYLLSGVNTQGENLLDCINDLAQSINGGAEFAPSGEVRIVRNAVYRSDAVRNLLISVANFTTEDALGITINHEHIDLVGRVEAAAGVFSSVTSQMYPVLSIAPGVAQGSGEGQSPLQRQILQGDVPLATAQAEINARAGYHYAAQNGKTTLNITFPDGYHFLIPSKNQWYTWTLGADTNNRGFDYTTGTRWQLSRISHTHNNETGSKQVEGSFIIETTGAAGQSYIPPTPETTTPTVPTIPVFPTYPGFPEIEGVLFPAPTLPSLPPITTPTAPGAPNGQASLNGNTAVIWDSNQAWITFNYKVTTSPTWIEITPDNVTSGHSIRDVKWGIGNKRLYLLTSDDTDSNVFYKVDGTDTSGTWSKGDDTTGSYTLMRTTTTPGQVYIYSPDDSGTSAWCYTFDFTANNGSWQLRGVSGGGSGTEGVYTPGTGWQALTNQVIGSGGGDDYNTRLVVRRTFTATTLTSITATYNYTRGSLFDAESRQAILQAGTTIQANPTSRDSSPVPPTTGTGKTLSWSGTISGAVIIQLNIVASGIEENTGTPATNGAVTLTEVEVCGTGLNPFGGGGSSTASVRYSTNNGDSFAAAEAVGSSSLTGFGGFDLAKVSAQSLAGSPGQTYKATTAGGAYSAYGTLFPEGANPNAIWIPRYQFNTSSDNTAVGSLQYLTASATPSTTGSLSLWRVTSVGSTFTDVTPIVSSNPGLAISPDCIAMPQVNGAKAAAILSFNGTLRLQTTANAGTGWTDRGSLASAANYIRYRRTDTAAVELYFTAGSPYYSSNHGATYSARTYPGSLALTGIEILA